MSVRHSGEHSTTTDDIWKGKECISGGGKRDLRAERHKTIVIILSTFVHEVDMYYTPLSIKFYLGDLLDSGSIQSFRMKLVFLTDAFN